MNMNELQFNRLKLAISNAYAYDDVKIDNKIPLEKKIMLSADGMKIKYNYLFKIASTKIMFEGVVEVGTARVLMPDEIYYFLISSIMTELVQVQNSFVVESYSRRIKKKRNQKNHLAI